MAGTTSKYGLRYPDNSDPIDVAADLQKLAETTEAALTNGQFGGRMLHRWSSEGSNVEYKRGEWVNVDLPKLNTPSWGYKGGKTAWTFLRAHFKMEVSGIGDSNDGNTGGVFAVRFVRDKAGSASGKQTTTGESDFFFTHNGTWHIAHAWTWDSVQSNLPDEQTEIGVQIFINVGWTVKILWRQLDVYFLEHVGETINTANVSQMSPDSPPAMDPEMFPTQYVTVQNGIVTTHLTDLAWANRISDKPSIPVTVPQKLGDGTKAVFDGSLWTAAP